VRAVDEGTETPEEFEDDDKDKWGHQVAVLTGTLSGPRRQ
jgi:hypothetical protein